ncbi:chemotaxis protein CheD [Granulicella aggregans]|jgi:chemotaxis protein CheD|uniref:Probable chemoreceptor glutamine deamidase CheD n=1 Tax=Granulicella aggregans TaxID=474949 RepID=A0A7W7ZFU3_9BACT|nr:chemotaxis protein CheD [Granulicella aggregans]MBB5059139.1 chemotaxis protein CheD [Granulicella aggregans]
MSHVLTVGISDCAVSGDPNAVITTHALGSCVGLLIYDPVARVGGLLHYMLPDSTMDKDRAAQKPFMFADTGIPLLFHTAYKAGARKERIQVTALGGAQILGTNDSFSIGKRNLMSMRKILWKAGVMLHHEEVGGTSPRTARLEVASGKILVSFGRGQHEVHQGITERREANGL